MTQDDEQPTQQTESHTPSLTLKTGETVLVDGDSLNSMKHYEWHLSTNGYARRFSATGGAVYMHREIAVAPPGFLVDHINGNHLDNRRCNLRVCSASQNQMNRPKPKTTAAIASRFKGVSWDKCNSKWRAKITLHGKQRHLGYFASEEDAALAYDSAALVEFGKFAKINGSA